MSKEIPENSDGKGRNRGLWRPVVLTRKESAVSISSAALLTANSHIAMTASVSTAE